jgi:hypothetical protein
MFGVAARLVTVSGVNINVAAISGMVSTGDDTAAL